MRCFSRSLRSCAATLIAASTAAMPVRAETPGWSGEFRVADSHGLGQIEAGTESVRDGRFAARALSDLVVRLVDIRQRDPAPPVLGPTLFRRTWEMQVLLVSQGRLTEAGAGRCAASSGQRIVCTLDCDGGDFSLEQLGSGAASLALVLGRQEGGPAGVRLGACEPAPALLLRPRRGMDEVRIRLELLGRQGAGQRELGPPGRADDVTGSIVHTSRTRPDKIGVRPGRLPN